jgi:hypothetical protein
MPNVADGIDPNVRSVRYIIVLSRACCTLCSVVTAVFAFALPAGYESLNVDDDTPDDESGTWEAPGMAAILSYVEYLPESVADRIRVLTSHYRIDQDNHSGESLWMNHCQNCGALLDEEELHGDPNCPFGPLPCEGLEALVLHEVREPFEAWAGAESRDLVPLDS